MPLFGAHVHMKRSHSDYHYTASFRHCFLCDAKWLNQSRANTKLLLSIVRMSVIVPIIATLMNRRFHNMHNDDRVVSLVLLHK